MVQLKMFPLAVVLTASLGLVACSSSKDDNSTSTQSTPTPSTSSNTGSGSSGNTNSNSNANNNATGVKGVVAVKSGNGAFTPASSSSSSRDTLVVNGKTLSLETSGIVSGTFTQLSDSKSERAISGRSLSYTRFGAYTLKNTPSAGQNELYVFANGQTVSNMPTTGSATYTGNSLYRGYGASDWTYGTSSFNVNYGSKSLTGAVNPNVSSVGEIKMTGTISGDTFTGSSSSHAGTTVNGRFFGPNAAEMGGVFTNSTYQNTGFHGAFGAKK